MKRKQGRPPGKKSFKNLRLIDIELDKKSVRMWIDNE